MSHIFGFTCCTLVLFAIILAGCDGSGQLQSVESPTPAEMARVSENAFAAAKSLGGDPEIATHQIDISNSLLAIVRSYSLCSSHKEFKKVLESELINKVEELFLFREGIDKVQENANSGNASTLAGEMLMFLGWEFENADDLISQLISRSKKLGIWELNKPVIEDDSFKAFLSDAIIHKKNIQKETMTNWPEGWGDKPSSWKGIRNPKNDD